MIRIYEAGTTNFDNEGLGSLPDRITNKVTEVRNGQFDLTMTYPKNGWNFDKILEHRIIYSKHDPYSDPQPFEIDNITENMDGTVKIHAGHVTYGLRKITVSPFEATDIDDAFDKLLDNATTPCPFSFDTNKVIQSGLSITKPLTIRQALGGVAGSFLDVYKGEFEWDGYHVVLWTNRGSDNNVVIKYGKNLTQYKRQDSVEELYTGIYPYWTGTDASGNDTIVTLPEKIVYIEDYETYDRQYTVPVDFSSSFKDAPTEEQLRNVAQSYIENNDISSIRTNVKFNFVVLRQVKEYEDIAPLERVRLCDIVTVDFGKTQAKAKVVKVVYNEVNDRYDSLELGETKDTLTSAIIAHDSSIKEMEIETRTSFENKITEALGMLKGAYGGHMVIGTNANGQPNELFFLDTDNVAEATYVLRLGSTGIGLSNKGINGPYNTAILINGTADMSNLNVINLMADRITGGILQDQEHKNWWNLDTGEIHLGGDEEAETVSQLQSDIEAIYKNLVPFKITEDGLVVSNGTSIDNGVIVTDSMRIRNTFQVGNHVWLARSNGTNTTLVYVGD